MGDSGSLLLGYLMTAFVFHFCEINAYSAVPEALHMSAAPAVAICVLTVPIFDNRQTKTAINKAILSKQNYQLDLRDKQTQLYSTIENYWLQAYNNQAQYKSAKVSTQSAQESYDLLQEQFKQNLKNVIELLNGKDQLHKAKQSELQAKYLAILNIDLLNFYKDGTLKK